MTLALGDRAPTFSLPDTHGEDHRPDIDAPATVVIFTCNHCPYALAWHERLIDAARDYAARGVRFLAINANDAQRYPRDSAPAMAQRVAADGDEAEQRAAAQRWEAALLLARAGKLTLAASELADLAVGLLDIRMRDAVLVRAADDSEALLSLLLTIARATVPPDDAPVCTLLAVTAWVRGDGALANIALDRAQATDPAYSLATLIRIGLDRAVPPREVSRWLRASASRGGGPTLSG